LQAGLATKKVTAFLPREANRAFYDAVIAACHRAGFAPTVLELPDGHIERGLMAVAAGAGMALLPGSVAGRYSAPGVRFVPLEGDAPAFTAAVLTRRDTAHMPTVALLRAVSQAATPRSFEVARHSISAA
jgi:DNA-binding transcriptional LysR family regulator